MIMSNATAAFSLGTGWAFVLLIYGHFSDADVIPSYKGTIRSAIRISFDTVFVGGGTGVVVYVTDSYLSSFQYGLAGMVSAFLVVTIAVKLRSKH